VNGRIDDSQLLFAAWAFSESAEGDFRILVAHHNLIPAPDHEPHQFLPGYQRCLKAFSRMRVDLVLGGHLHRAFLGSSLDAYPQARDAHGIVIAHSGTTTSTRGRARERGQNSLNLIRVETGQLSIVPHLFNRTNGEFLPTGTHTFSRAGA